MIYQALDDYDTALIYGKQSLKIFRQMGDLHKQCVTLLNLGFNYFDRDQDESAYSKWIESYRMAVELDSRQILDTFHNMAIELGENGLEYWEELSEKSDGKSARIIFPSNR